MSDFNQMLIDIGITAESMAEISAERSDCIPMPPRDYKFKIDVSPIHGEGVFATSFYKENEVIGPVRIGLNRTPLGYKTNHSGDPNSETVGLEDGTGYMRTLRPIEPGEEITIDYRHAVNEARKVEHQILASEGVQGSWNQLAGLVKKGADRLQMRAAIDALEIELLKMPQANHGLEHLFTDGLYIRVATIQKGTLFTTPIYNEECVLTMLKGKLLIITEKSAGIVDPPSFVLTEKGTKRAILALEDVLAHTIHPNPTNDRDIENLESRIYGSKK